MRFFYLLILYVFLSTCSFAQGKDSVICDNPEIEAQYFGGHDSIFNYIERNLVYPERALKDEQEGTVQLIFVVEKNGSISEIEILRSVSPLIDKEAKRLVTHMPSWKPAIVDERTCRSKVRMSLIFNIDFEKARRKKARKERRMRRRL